MQYEENALLSKNSKLKNNKKNLTSFSMIVDQTEKSTLIDKKDIEG